MTYIQWLSPNIAWSMDGYEYFFKRIKSFANQVQDMTSKYKFDPQAGTEIACGEEIAGELRYLFTRNNPPLFFKLDNGSNLNHIAVFDAMEDFGVIPLNSPAYYPQYNGSMEHTQGEIKRELDKMANEFDHPDFFPFAAKQAVHQLNHKPRPSLQGAWSCSVWQLHSHVRYSKQFRFDTYCEICQLAFDIEKEVQYIDRELVKCKSWRKAVQTWLHVNGHITIKRNGKVLPIFT